MLKVPIPVLYMVALSEPKLNENSEHGEVESFLISGGIQKYSLRICQRFSAYKTLGN